jgi:hypothetical protein
MRTDEPAWRQTSTPRKPSKPWGYESRRAAGYLAGDVEGEHRIARRGIDQFNWQFTSTQELDLDDLAPDVVFDNSNSGFDAAVATMGSVSSCRWCGGFGSSSRPRRQEVIRLTRIE